MRKAVQHLKAADPVLAAIIQRVGPCRITYREPSFSTLARSIIYQQLSGAAAGTVLKRLLLIAGVGEDLQAERILALGVEGMRPCGVSRQKASYLLDLSAKSLDGSLVFDDLHLLSDDDIIGRLTQVKGVGVWSAHMFLMFAMQRPDVLPTGDLGVRNAIQRAYSLAAHPTPGQVEEIARPWRPYATVASWYLWRSLDGDAAM